MPIYNTAEDGAVMIKTDGQSMGIQTYNTEREDYYRLTLNMRDKKNNDKAMGGGI